MGAERELCPGVMSDLRPGPSKYVLRVIAWDLVRKVASQFLLQTLNQNLSFHYFLFLFFPCFKIYF